MPHETDDGGLVGVDVRQDSRLALTGEIRSGWAIGLDERLVDLTPEGDAVDLLVLLAGVCSHGDVLALHFQHTSGQTKTDYMIM